MNNTTMNQTNQSRRYSALEPDSSSSSNETKDFASASKGPETETESEQNPLASLFYSEELSPFEPRPNPFQSFLSSLLQYNSSQPLKTHEMASSLTNPTTNGTSSKEVRMTMPREFSGK